MEALNSFNSKIDDIDRKGRFVNLYGNFSPLCGVARWLRPTLFKCVTFKITSSFVFPVLPDMQLLLLVSFSVITL